VIQLDTFRNTDISFGPGEDIGIVAETTYGAKILDWFYQRGIVPSIEGATMPTSAFSSARCIGTSTIPSIC